MRLKVAIVNAALAIVLIFLIFKTVGVWRTEVDLPEKAASEKAEKSGNSVVKWENSLPSEKAFDTIVKKNLFTQSRSDFVPVEEEPVEEVVETKIRGKRIALYGVMIYKGNKSALITNPVQGKDEPKYRWVNEGDAFKNFSVERIDKDNILVRDGSQAYKILLTDEENKSTARSGGSSGDDTPNVIVTGSTADAFAETSPKTENQDTTSDEYEWTDSPFGPMQIRKN